MNFSRVKLLILSFIVLFFSVAFISCFGKSSDKTSEESSISLAVGESKLDSSSSKSTLTSSDSNDNGNQESDSALALSDSEIPIEERVPAELLAMNKLLKFNFLTSNNSRLKKDVSAEIIGTRITVVLPNSLNSSSIIPTVKISDYATVSPASGVAINLNSGSVKYVVTAQNGTKKIYYVSLYKSWDYVNFDQKRALSYGTFGYRADFKDTIVTGQSFKPSSNLVLKGAAFSFFGKFRNDKDFPIGVTIGLDLVDITTPGNEKILQTTYRKVGQKFNGGDIYFNFRRYQRLNPGKEYCLTLFLVNAQTNFSLNNLRGTPDNLSKTGSKFSSRLINSRSEKDWRYFSEDDGWDLWMTLYGGVKG